MPAIADGIRLRGEALLSWIPLIFDRNSSLQTCR